MGDLSGRVAIITGASAGIGEATARALGREGMRVALCARRKDRLERVASEIGAAGGTASVYALDVTDEAGVQQMVGDVVTRWGRVDVLMNNAGRGLAATLEETTPQELRALLELNLVAVVTGTRAVLPIMRRQRSGHIINLSSVVGRRAIPYRSAYAATKFALGGLSEALRVELHGSGIAVTIVYPIFTVTEFHDVETKKVEPRRIGPAQSVDRVARAIVRCVRRPRAEVYPYWPARILHTANVLAPGLVDLVVRRVMR